MSTSTTQSTAIMGLSDQTLDKLRELRRMNIDSAKGFEECAELVEDHGVKKAFTELAAERRQLAQALAAQIEWNAESEPEEGSYLAAMHRAWIKVREACSSDDVEAVVSEAKRGESKLCEAYAEAEDATSGRPIHQVIRDQHAEVKKACGRLDGLCTAKSC